MKARHLLLLRLTLSLLCVGGCSTDSLVGAAPRTDNAAIFDEVWRTFDLHYSYFALRGVDWKESRARFRPAAVDAASDAELAAVLGTMMRDLRDVHVVLTPANGIASIRYLSDVERQSARVDAAVVESYVSNAALTSGEKIRFGYLEPGIGYIAIPSFRGRAWAGEIDEALRALDVSAVVIDVRDNGGGDNGLAIDIAGRFADRERTYGFVRLRDGPAHDDFTDFIPERVRPAGVRFRGAVVVLTNRQSMSAAEDFVLAMRSIPGVRIVGDTTAGASGGPIIRELPNGWTFQLSEWIAYTADRRTFETVGLAPDIAVAARAQAGDVDVFLDAARTVARAQIRHPQNASGGRGR